MTSENNTRINESLPKKKRTATVRKKVYSERHVISFLFFICLLLSLVLAGLLGCLVSLKIPDIRNVSHYQPMQTSYIFDRRGDVVEKIYVENRTVIGLKQMPALLPKAFVAAEDGRFYEHQGLDFFSVLRAVFINIRRGERAHGGSTITQQVARSLLLNREKTYLRKFKEAILAWRIDKVLSKDDILFIYLNQIYLGSGAYGVEAASQTYFAKHASHLTLGEMAILAGLPQAPSSYSPAKNIENAIRRERYVLNRMVDDGYITSEQAQKAFVAHLQVAEEKNWQQGNASYYTALVKARVQPLITRPLAEAGLRISTYMDASMQNAAVEAVQNGVKEAFARQIVKKSKVEEVPQAALVSIDAASGQVRALVGGSDYATSHYNRAAFARRQAGSAFKPILFSAALENGWQPESLILDAPLTISGGHGKVWSPKNYDGKYHGEVTLTTALTHSYNSTAVRLLKKVGIDKVSNLAFQMGLGKVIPHDLSLALGSIDVTPLQLTFAYTPFLSNGYRSMPAFIEKIETPNAIFTPKKQVPRQVISPKTAAKMRHMLEEVVTHGTGRSAAGLPGITGGKTGTTNDQHDAWFIGYNGRIVTGVWVGNDHNQSLGSGETGGRTAVPIWFSFMQATQSVR